MKKITVFAEVTYRVDFECEVEVPDDFGDDEIPYELEEQINSQVVEAAREYDHMLEVDDIDWFEKKARP